MIFEEANNNNKRDIQKTDFPGGKKQEFDQKIAFFRNYLLNFLLEYILMKTMWQNESLIMLSERKLLQQVVIYILKPVKLEQSDFFSE